MRNKLIVIAACLTLFGALAALPSAAAAVFYNYGGPMCNWAGPWDGVYWRWSPYYNVHYIYSYSGGGWRYYVVAGAGYTWSDTWARPIACGA